MNHRSITSLTAAMSLAACHDITTPEPVRPLGVQSEPVAQVAIDSSEVWASQALDDAATRLLSGFDEEARRDLKQALLDLNSRLDGRNNESLSVAVEQASLAVARLRSRTDAASLADLDALTLAIDRAVATGAKNREKR